MMTAAELLCKLLEFPPDQPVEIETTDGTRLGITGVENSGWGVVLQTSDDVTARKDADDLFDSAFKVVKAVNIMRQKPFDEAFEVFGTVCEANDQFIDQYVNEEDLK